MTTIRARARNLLLRLFSYPLFGGVATVAGVIAGYLGSHYDQQVFSSFYPVFWPHTVFSIEATLFWCFTLTFGMSFTGTFWAQAETSTQTNGEMQSALRELLTIPPRGFIQSYRNYAVSAVEFLAALDTPALTPQQIESAVRTQLDILLKTIAAYEAPGTGTVYGANIMLFVDATGAFFAQHRAALQQRVRCIEPGVDIANLTGILDLNLQLSVRSDTNAAPDDRLTALALPVPKAPAHGVLSDLKGVVPGAPYCFVKQTEAVYVGQSEMLMEISSNNHFTIHVVEELRSILSRQAADVQSLVCVPLYAVPATAARLPIGVLNVHKNTRDERAPGKFLLLGPLLAPLLTIVGKLVSEL